MPKIQSNSSDWEIKDAGGGNITARHRVTKESFSGTMANFNSLAKNSKFIHDPLVIEEKQAQAASMWKAVTASRVAQLADSFMRLRCTSASAINITVNSDAATGWSEAEELCVYQGGAGAVNLVAGAGVTLRGTPKTAAQYVVNTLMRVGVNEWVFK